MITAYYSKGCNSKELFKKYEISGSTDFEKHLNKYDVIRFDVQWCLGACDGADKLISYLTENILKELRDYYPDELSGNYGTISETLSSISRNTGNKFIIVIDEWDALIRNKSCEEKIQNDYIFP